MPTRPSGEDPIIAENLSKRFRDFVAVDRVTFRIRRGEVMGFIGPNGAGKSTTMRILCGLLKPSAGKAMVAGIDVSVDPEGVRQHIGYMSQKFSLYNDLTVIENLRFFGGIYRVKRKKLSERIAFAIEMAGLEGRENSIVATLAGGWKQRLALGCAILHEPPILFLDEPTSGVDPTSRRHFWELIHALAGNGVTFLVTTHYMDEAEYCNRIALINQGKMVAIGSPTELKNKSVPGDLLLVESDGIGAAIPVLTQTQGIRDVAAFGNALHVLTEGHRPDSQALIKKALDKRGIRTLRISPISPSLEDVFVGLVTRPPALQDPNYER